MIPWWGLRDETSLKCSSAFWSFCWCCGFGSRSGIGPGDVGSNAGATTPAVHLFQMRMHRAIHGVRTVQARALPLAIRRRLQTLAVARMALAAARMTSVDSWAHCRWAPIQEEAMIELSLTFTKPERLSGWRYLVQDRNPPHRSPVPPGQRRPFRPERPRGPGRGPHGPGGGPKD